MVSLTADDRARLDFEREWWRHADAKDEAVADVFGETAEQHRRVLDAVIDTDAAVEYDRMLVVRLRRQRALHA